MLRDVAYSSLSFKRRRELHMRAGEILEKAAGDHPETAADVLALHFSIGQDHARAWYYSRIAGDQARETYANVDAATHYQRALEAGRRMSDVSDAAKAEIWTALGDVRELSGNFDESLATYRKATALAHGDPLALARLAEKRARVRERSGDYNLALREITGGHRRLASIDSEEAARTRAGLSAFAASVRLAQQKLPQAIKQALQAADEAELAGERAALARAYSVLDLSYRWSGQPEKAVYAPKALAIYEELGDLNGQGVVHGNMGIEAYYDGRWDDAIDHYRKARDAFRRTGNEVNAANAESNMAEVLVNQGRLEEARPLLEDAHRVMLASGMVDGASFVEVQLARILAAGGHFEDAVELYEKARRQLLELGETTYVADLVLYLATCYLEAGRPEEAIAAIDGAETVVGKDWAVHSAGMLRVRGVALAELGELEAASDAIAMGLEVAEQQGLPYETGLLLLAKDRLEHPRGAELGQSAARGLEILKELGVEIHPELVSSD
jgi:tetratricopeptide (TPR) repeat protein